ncbi:hypothetical protein LXL04_029545 [Taraxacum kok-saghyz]
MEIALRKCMLESEDKQTTNVGRFFSLPDDILLEILTRVPDAFLRYRVKYVCTRWFDIITNMILLDHASFILQHLQNVGLSERLVDISQVGGQRVRVKEQYIKTPGVGSVWSWLNEFILISAPVGFGLESLYVFNLITAEQSRFPQCTLPCYGAHFGSRCGIALSYDGVQGTYKVVHLFMGPPIECEIFVLSRGMVCRVTSKWEKFQVPYMDKGTDIWGDAVSVQGRFLHWRIQDSNNLVSVDSVKEKVSTISLPGSSEHGRFVYSVFELNGFLAFFDGVTTHGKAEIWVLKDFHRVNWEKLHSIRVDNSYFERHPDHIKVFRFRGMISERYIILEHRSRCYENGMFSYDLKYGVLKKLDIEVHWGDKQRIVQSLAPPCRRWKPKKTISH